MSNLLFNPQDFKTKHHLLARILRLLFTKEHITEDSFYELHYRSMSDQETNPMIIQRERNNLKKILKYDDLTWKMLRRTIVDVLHLDIVDVSITMRRTDTKELFTVSSRDYVDQNDQYVSATPIDLNAENKKGTP